MIEYTVLYSVVRMCDCVCIVSHCEVRFGFSDTIVATRSTRNVIWPSQ